MTIICLIHIHTQIYAYTCTRTRVAGCCSPYIVCIIQNTEHIRVHVHVHHRTPPSWIIVVHHRTSTLVSKCKFECGDCYTRIYTGAYLSQHAEATHPYIYSAWLLFQFSDFKAWRWLACRLAGPYPHHAPPWYNRYAQERRQLAAQALPHGPCWTRSCACRGERGAYHRHSRMTKSEQSRWNSRPVHARVTKQVKKRKRQANTTM
jgi:hypothetical protein